MLELQTAVLQIALGSLNKKVPRYRMQAPRIVQHDKSLTPGFHQGWFIQCVGKKRWVHGSRLWVETESSSYDVDNVVANTMLITHSGKLWERAAIREHNGAYVFSARLLNEV